MGNPPDPRDTQRIYQITVTVTGPNNPDTTNQVTVTARSLPSALLKAGCLPHETWWDHK